MGSTSPQPERPDTTLESLSRTIARNASLVGGYLQSNHFNAPSFDENGPATVLPDESPESVQQAREELIAASLEMFQLALGPSEFLPHLAVRLQQISILSWLCHFRIFQLVPLNGIVSYEKLAAAINAPVQRLKSIIRMAMTTHLFRECEGGSHVGHSAISALMARDGDAFAYAAYLCNRTAPMVMGMTGAHSKWGPASTNANETAYNCAFNTDLPFFHDIAGHQEREAEFARYMKSVRSSEGVSLKHLVSGFDWQSVRNEGTIVDIGGSTGGSAVVLADAFPHLKFVVQDRPENASTGRKLVEEAQTQEVASRISFQAYDFMQTQPIVGADVYMLRMILHDWPDDDSIRILTNVASAMGESSRLLIMDTVLPEPGSVPVSVERIARARDMTMLQAFNSKERELEDWKVLLDSVQPMLKLVNIKQPPRSAMSVLEVVLGS